MTIELTVTAKGQVTLRQAVLDHLGVKPGAKICVSMFARWTGRSLALRDRPATTFAMSGASSAVGSSDRSRSTRCAMRSKPVVVEHSRRHQCAGALPDMGRRSPGCGGRRGNRERRGHLDFHHRTCELAWVLKRAYRYRSNEIADAIRRVATSATWMWIGMPRRLALACLRAAVTLPTASSRPTPPVPGAVTS